MDIGVVVYMDIQSQITQQVKFIYSPIGIAFEKQTKKTG